jgi:UTP--glucose-1-phosphate uridylyltransferase
VRYDCGSKLGYLKANVAYGLKHPEIAVDFARHLATLRRHPIAAKRRN